MVEVLKIFKQHIFYVANSTFGIIPYNHSLNSTFDACPEVFFVEGLKKRRKKTVKLWRVCAFFDGLKFHQNDRCQISILRRDKSPHSIEKNEIIAMR